MHKLAIITGTHQGLGRALAETFLENPDFKVWGFSRKNEIQHTNFTFFHTDLSKSDFHNSLPDRLPVANEYVLINNAAIIEPIAPAHSIDAESLEKIYKINVQAVHLLSAWFIRHTLDRKVAKTIVNISSGAARYPITHWSPYCSTKAALDMLSECLALEYPSYRVYSFAPGMVDTPMQSHIRSKSLKEFPEVDRFKAAFKNNNLNNPYSVSKKIIHLIQNPLTFTGVKISIKDL
ncbi:short-chain dehydrogenase [Thermaurantimonas aggregans]|uniref:Short-chain dehydrogenase n=1 Tax=Thermaurantimonas aggregans TaxID=2173829 RepID=A0A401XKA6_9FLAO|nr:SDR family NAD(P)-dependent oxidoreductase [Thermaurantimonas aggregans]MCX8148361.1 SDR family NAD(P)-dependent oxidoreductase [Thermaurantimonas aggregans]GCD77449.1 short-chain dehydrogenase [Thermaurantimonas aggregans]